MEPTTIVQIVAGVLMVLCVAIIIMRRKVKKKKEDGDETDSENEADEETLPEVCGIPNNHLYLIKPLTTSASASA